MFETIGVCFVFVMTAIIAYASYYECMHTDKNHGYNKKKMSKLKNRYKTLWGH